MSTPDSRVPPFVVDSSMSLLMDKLRNKAHLQKSLAEFNKLIRVAVMDRRFSLDSQDKAILQTSLDSLQTHIKVRSAQDMALRLETIGRQLGLKFMGAPVHGCFYLSTEMFYLEIHIDSNGVVKEAKIHHIDAAQQQQQQQSSAVNCHQIMNCLNKGDFTLFIQHLKGLVQVYNVKDVTTQDKSRIWKALSVLEEDLEVMANSYKSWKGDHPMMYLLRTSLGQVEPRAGGLPMRIRYFVSPYDLLDEKTQSLLPYSLEVIEEKDLGHVATVTLEKSDQSHYISMRPMINKQGNPMDASVNNCVPLPIHFVLELKKPMVLSIENCKEIEKVTRIVFCDESKALPVMRLITLTESKRVLDTENNRGLFVSLPDQQHCYCLTDHQDMKGVLVSSIPFESSVSVANILNVLRQQALFNTLISSCCRVNSLQDLEKSLMFEVSSLDLKHISVSFDLEEQCISTVEFDLTDILKPRCTIYSPYQTEQTVAEEITNKVIQSSLSIPITMRALIIHNSRNKLYGNIHQQSPKRTFEEGQEEQEIHKHFFDQQSDFDPSIIWLPSTWEPLLVDCQR